MDVLSLSAAELLERYRAKQLSPVEVTRAALDRIAKLQPTYNAFVTVGEREALQAARESEARWMRGEPAGLVDGLPTTVKDLLLAKGWPTYRGSRTVDPNQPWDEDSAAVARMREQGAVFLGKTTTPEFGWKGVTDSPLTGLTVNPWDTTKTPGGSSGGAAVAAAFGMGVMHIATDGGGSIRIPAGFCGLFGFKPTFGLVPVHPHPPPWTLWHQGPISRTVHDAALMLTVISRPDVRDFYAAPPLGHRLSRRARRWHPRHARRLQPHTRICQGRRGGRSSCRQSRGHPRSARRPRRGDRPAAEGPHRESCNRCGPSRSRWPCSRSQPSSAASWTSRSSTWPSPASTVSALEYRALEKQRETLARRMNLLHQQYDLLVTPQLATTAFAVNHEVPPGNGMKRWWEWSPFTYPFNLTQQPAATVPCGFAPNGLPVAMQIVGAKFAETKVLRAARAYEQARPFVMPELPAGVR